MVTCVVRCILTILHENPIVLRWGEKDNEFLVDEAELISSNILAQYYQHNSLLSFEKQPRAYDEPQELYLRCYCVISIVVECPARIIL
jgi:hypothetical protein